MAVSLSLALLLFLLFPSNGGQPLSTPPTYILDSQTLSVTGAEGTCTDPSVEVCSSNVGSGLSNLTCERCSTLRFRPENILDRDNSTTWLSTPSFTNPSLTIDLGQEYNVSMIEVLFTRTPRIWVLDYSTDNVSFSPGVALVLESNDCQNFTSYLYCLVYMQEIDLLSLSSQGSFPKISQIKLTFIEPPAPSMVQDPREEFIEIDEIFVGVVCESASSLFNGNCNGTNRVYKPVILVSVSGNITSQLVWSQVKETATPPLGTWFMDDVLLSISNNEIFNEDFERQLNGSVWPFINGGQLNEDHCSVYSSDQQVLLFSQEGESPGRPRGVTLNTQSSYQSVEFLLGFLDPSLQCVNNPRGEVELTQCASGREECTLLGVYVLNDCGDCVNQHLLSLRNLITDLQVTLSQLPPYSILIIANTTDISIITDTRTQYQRDYFNWLLGLTAVERAHGFPSEYPRNITLPTHIATIEVPVHNLELFDRYCSLVENISQYNDIGNRTARVVSMAEALAQSVTQYEYETASIVVDTEALTQDTLALLSRLISHLNNISAAIDRGMRSLDLIQSRNYDRLSEDIARLFNASMSISREAAILNDIAETHYRALRNISDSIVLNRERLNGIVNTSRRAIEMADSVSTTLDQVDELIGEIESLINEGNLLKSSIDRSISLTRGLANSTGDLLLEGNRLQLIANGSLLELMALISSLSSRVGEYSDDLNRYLPPGYPAMCELGTEERTVCTDGEIHSKHIELNATRIISESTETRHYARVFLDGLTDPPQVDFEYINETASEAIEIGQEVLVALEDTGLDELAMSVDRTSVDIGILSVNVSLVMSDVGVTLANAQGEFNRSVVLEEEVVIVQDRLVTLTDSISELEQTQNYTEEALGIIDMMWMVQGSLGMVNSSINALEEDLITVRGSLGELVDVIRETNESLDYAEQEVIRVEDFLSKTAQTLNQTTFDLNTTIQLNNDIIADIDTLLNSVDSAHALLRKINSPAKFQANGTIQPYLSLQAPPSHEDDLDTLQFDSLEIYLNAEGEYNPPGLIFYTGPLVEEGAPANDSTLDSEDYMAIVDRTSPSRAVALEWRIGGLEGSESIPYTVSDQIQIFVRRVGSMFELDSKSTSPDTTFDLVEGSLLFKVTPNTVFLFGGKPPGARLALADYSIYNPLLGTLDLVVYNGDLWSLWNYRRHSQTQFIGPYRRHTDAIEDNTLGENRLSFDGDGYLKPRVFSDNLDVGSPPAYSIVVGYRVDSLEGLLMYLYDPISMVSMELAIINGQLCLLLKDNVNSDVDFCFPDENDNFQDGSVEIRFASNRVGLLLGTPSQEIANFNTFSDLSRVEAWFGGVALDQLPESFRPNTIKGIRGCVDVDIILQRISLTIALFGQSEFFIQNYLNTPTQKGFSGTCFISNYVQQVSLNGTDYLSYTALDVADTALTSSTPDNKVTISLSFFPQRDNVLLFAAIDGIKMIVVELVNLMVQSTFSTDSGTSVTELATQSISLMEWHHLILEIRTQSHSEGEGIRLFVDNALVVSNTLPGFTFTLPMSGSSTDPVLHMGGAPNTIRQSTSNFVGCLKNFIYNLDAIKLLTYRLTSTVSRESITFDKCLYLPNTIVTDLPAISSEPQMVSTCSSADPITVNDTIGGFHALTRVLSFNVLPFQSTSWSFQLSLRTYSRDGHVITFPSHDVSLSLVIDNGNIRWILVGHDGSNTSSAGQPVTLRNWHQLQTLCNVSRPFIHCTIVNDDVIVGVVSHRVSRDVFYPALPIVLGRNGEKRGFVGCIRDLQANGRSLGYDLEGLSTCEHCYGDPIDGWGFKGLGYLMKSVPSQATPIQYNIQLSFKPSRDHGLLLYIHSPTDNTPVFAAGLYNGELRVTNFTRQSLGGVAPSSMSLSGSQSLCNSSGTPFHTLSVEVTESSIGVMLINGYDSSQSQFSLQTDAMVTTSIDVYIGGVADDLEETSLFQFLLSDEGAALNSPVPGFIGCMRSIDVTNGSGSPNLISMVTDADHYSGIMDGLCPN